MPYDENGTEEWWIVMGEDSQEAENTEQSKMFKAYRIRRLLAFFVDYGIVLAGPFFLLESFDSSILYSLAPYDHWTGLAWAILYLGTCCLVFRGQTLGLKATNLQLLTHDSTQPGPVRLLIRHGVLLLFATSYNWTPYYINSWFNPTSELLSSFSMVAILATTGNLFFIVFQSRGCQLIHDQLAGVFCIDQGLKELPEAVKFFETKTSAAWAALVFFFILLGAPSAFLRSMEGDSVNSWIDDEMLVEQELFDHPWIRDVYIYDDEVTISTRVFPPNDEHYNQMQKEVAEVFYQHIGDTSTLTVEISPEFNFLVYRATARELGLTHTNDRAGWLEASQ